MTSAAHPAADEIHRPGGRIAWLYSSTIFISAFLLFQVELILSSYVLPWFGGSAAVWTTTMLVFQTLLFAAYGYAHKVSNGLRLDAQRRLHVSLIAVSVLALALGALQWPSPVTPGASWKPADPGHPVLHIVAVLLASVGAPFFLLAVSGPLLQAWYARARDRAPYRLYAVSNLGSLLGLLSYPFVVEPLLKLRQQAWAWSVLYLAFAGGIVSCARTIAHVPEPVRAQELHEAEDSRMDLSRRVFWILLPACASVALLAGTSLISLYIAAVPLVWVLPLAIYLLSFIICFGKPAWYVPGVFHALYGMACIALLLAIASTDVWLQLAACLFVLFAICMICHGEVVRIQPPAGQVTAYYLSLAGGGALGGIFVGVLAPVLFSRIWEFQFVVIATGALIIVSLYRQKTSWLFTNPRLVALVLAVLVFGLPWATSLTNAIVANALQQMQYFRFAALFCVPLVPFLWTILAKPKSTPSVAGVSVLAIALAVLSFGLYRVPWASNGVTVARSRNFYGVLEVQRASDKVTLMHGKTVHGSQWLAPSLRQVPTIYYGPDSGLGQLMLFHPKRNPISPMRIGVVGMGAGTIAAYGLAGDVVRFYELNPGVLELAHGPKAWFSYVSDSRAQVSVALGDGRLSLERELNSGTAQNFDVLVLDAFNGDAIPVHLLTEEAAGIYLRHLAPQGVLGIHVSSTTLNLSPVLLALQRKFGLYGVATNLEDQSSNVSSVWVFLSRDQEALMTSGLRKFGQPLDQGKPAVLWTDDYTNIIGLMNR